MEEDARSRSELYALNTAPEVKPVVWAIQGCSHMWSGQFAEMDAKAEARRVGGSCHAYPLYAAPQERKPLSDAPECHHRPACEECAAHTKDTL